MSQATVSGAREPGGSGGRRRGRWARALGLAAGLATAAAARRPAAAEEPVVIHVRGRTQLHLTEGERTPGRGGRFELSVLVQLDDGQPAAAAEPGEGGGAAAEADPGRSFARQSVRLRLSGADGELGRLVVTTGPDGRGAASLGELPAGSYTVVADYAGDELRDPARADLTVDLGRDPVLLRLSAPSQAPRSGELPIRLSLLSDGEAFPATVVLRVDSLRRPVRMLGGFGQVAIPLRGLPALRKGQLLSVVASYPGDRLHASALQRRDVLLTSQAQVTLELAGAGGRPAASAELAQGSALIAVGAVRDEDGPLPGEPVDLEVSEQPGGERAGDRSGDPAGAGDEPAAEPPRPGRLTESGLTDARGRFRIVIRRLPLRPGPAVVAAQVTPRFRYILPARAAELPITVLPPEPVSAIYYVLPLLASSLGGLLWLAGRWLRPRLRRLLEALRARLRSRAAPEPAAASAGGPASSAPELPGLASEPGVSLAQSRWLPGLTLRRTVDTALEGQVVDAGSGRPVGGAALRVQPTAGLPGAGGESGRVYTAAANEEGRFTVSQLAAGRYVVEVSAPGYLPQRFPAAFPHRGELRGVSVRLEPLRARLLGEWRRVAQSLLGQESRLRTATPRELLAQFGRLRAVMLPYGAAARDLSRLTDLVEQACYSPRVCTPQMLEEATQLATAVLSSGAAVSAPLGAQLPAAGPPVPLR